MKSWRNLFKDAYLAEMEHFVACVREDEAAAGHRPGRAEGRRDGRGGQRVALRPAGPVDTGRGRTVP